MIFAVDVTAEQLNQLQLQANGNTYAVVGGYIVTGIVTAFLGWLKIRTDDTNKKAIEKAKIDAAAETDQKLEAARIESERKAKIAKEECDHDIAKVKSEIAHDLYNAVWTSCIEAVKDPQSLDIIEKMIRERSEKVTKKPTSYLFPRPSRVVQLPQLPPPEER